MSSNLSGGLGLRYYSTGNAMAMAQAGPNLAFVFDQFIQGSRSAYISGAFKLSNYLTLGGSVAPDHGQLGGI